MLVSCSAIHTYMFCEDNTGLKLRLYFLKITILKLDPYWSS